MSDEEELEAPPPPSIKGSVSPTDSIEAADGDWTCPDCGNVNFARRNACNRCSKARSPPVYDKKKRKLGQEIGKQAAEKSRGLFSAEDWQCNKCGNVNWARRQTCNVCNAPKFGDVEERTGFGGGYNDRGVVEYKEREDSSDDEYDEFGRRKKKRGDVGYKTPPREEEEIEEKVEFEKAPKHVEEEEEEEDDDDDEDGDLSKYDLSDWGEVKVDNKPKSKSRSRSRSRSPITKT